MHRHSLLVLLSIFSYAAQGMESSAGMRRDRFSHPRDQEEAKTEETPRNTLDAQLVERLIANSSQQIQDCILLLSDDEDLAGRPHKMLLVGPTGAGKTTLAQAIAQKLGWQAAFYKCSDMVDEYQNSGAQNIRRIFSKHFNRRVPQVIIFDEINALFDSNRTAQDSNRNTVETSLWLHLDGAAQRSNIFFIGISNNIEHMPLQLRTRFEGEIVNFSYPSVAQLKDILTFHIGTRHDFTAQQIDQLAEKMARYPKHYSFRQIERSVSEAIRLTRAAYLRAAAARAAQRATQQAEQSHGAQPAEPGWQLKFVEFNQRVDAAIEGYKKAESEQGPSKWAQLKSGIGTGLHYTERTIQIAANITNVSSGIKHISPQNFEKMANTANKTAEIAKTTALAAKEAVSNKCIIS